MRWNADQILSSASMSGSVVSQGIDLQYYFGWSTQAVWTGNPIGTLKIQVSDDIVFQNQAGIAPAGGPILPTSPAAQVVNWTDYSGSSASTTSSASAGSFLWNASEVGYRWMRVAYNGSSGSGILSVNFIGKGI